MGPITKWVVRRVVAGALALEAESLQMYRRLRERAGSRIIEPQLAHLLEEEKRHWQILEDAAAGRLDAGGLEPLVHEHLYRGIEEIGPLAGPALAEWRADLEAALAQEERTFVFYGNLRRISTIPSVRRAFEVIADMEREHIDILRRLLGSAAPPGGTGARRPRAGARLRAKGPRRSRKAPGR